MVDAEEVAEVFEKPVWETLSIFGASGIEITNINNSFFKGLAVVLSFEPLKCAILNNNLSSQ